MQRMQRIAFMVLLSMLSGCGGDLHSGYHEVTVNKTFALTIPSGITPTHELHDYAGFQGMYEQGRLFVVAMEEPKVDIVEKGMNYSLDQYASFVIAKTCKGLDKCNPGTILKTPLNAFETASCYLNGFISSEKGELPIMYQVTVIETPTHFVQVIFWMPQELEKQYAAVIEKIVKSFRFLK
jgi:hypothetical protein